MVLDKGGCTADKSGRQANGRRYDIADKLLPAVEHPPKELAIAPALSFELVPLKPVLRQMYSFELP
jgi:hypothetical protein